MKVYNLSQLNKKYHLKYFFLIPNDHVSFYFLKNRWDEYINGIEFWNFCALFAEKALNLNCRFNVKVPIPKCERLPLQAKNRPFSNLGG